VQRRYPAGPPPALSLRKADVLDLPFPDGSFDVSLAILAIHHSGPSHHDFTQIPTALAQLDRVLRPGGLLIYQEFLHQEPIRKWLIDHGYSIDRVRRRWRVESVVARKADGPPRPAPSMA
ncbi:MAG: class I SAM-dependent methyltransferase, partial [Thermoplasmata archaeon]